MADPKAQDETVEVPLDYLMFLHDVLRLNLSKNEEILGKSSSAALFDYASDDMRLKLKESVDPPVDLDDTMRHTKTWGFQTTTRYSDGGIEVRWDCPWAATVHPRLAPSDAGCPLVNSCSQSSVDRTHSHN